MSDEPVIKACVECKHFKGPQDLYTAQVTLARQEPECGHPRARSRDMIYGKAIARNERNDKKGCGQQGKLWESRKTEKKD